jgi:hypothetical protein
MISYPKLTSRIQIRTAEDILALTRELKEMWLFGALRKIGEGEEEGAMAEDSEKVLELVQKLLKDAREKGGTESINKVEV